MDRRRLFETSALIATGAVIGCASQAWPSQAPKHLFWFQRSPCRSLAQIRFFQSGAFIALGEITPRMPGRWGPTRRVSRPSSSKNPPTLFSMCQRRQRQISPLSALDQLPLRSRVGRMPGQRRSQYSCRFRARLGVRLLVGPGYDTPRSAARHGRSEETLGNWKEFRPFCSDWFGLPGCPHRTLHSRSDLAQSQRSGQAER